MNLHCVSQSSETLSKIFYRYYLDTFMILFLAGWLILIIQRVKRAQEGRRNKHEKTISQLLAPGFLLCVIIALWFSIGDGAPPNDRYALLHYVIWTFWVLGIYLERICVKKEAAVNDRI